MDGPVANLRRISNFFRIYHTHWSRIILTFVHASPGKPEEWNYIITGYDAQEYFEFFHNAAMLGWALPHQRCLL